jgi:transcriptional regulator NrdR family protein
MLGLLVGLILWLVIVGKASSRRGIEEAMGWKSAREVIERREALDAEDVHQMIAARNARRRARGEREVSLEEMEFKVSEELREQNKRRERFASEWREQQLNDRDLDELLEATNARRRARGEPERTREQVRREFGGGSGDARSDLGPGSPSPD